MDAPLLSVIVLAWDHLDYTRRCVKSIRETTAVPYELIIVDNGSEREAAGYAAEAADISVLNPVNRGFSMGMNQGLEVATGTFVAFVNNDTTLPEGWASMLLGVFELHPDAGIVLPAVTAGGNPVSVRQDVGSELLVLPRFRDLPSGVLYVMRTNVARELGGWGEEYAIASREDLDLLFKTWCSDLTVILDERILVEHASNVTATSKLPNKAEIWRANRDVFVAKWTAATVSTIPRASSCPPRVHAARIDEARTVATWMGRLFDAEDRLVAERELRRAERASAADTHKEVLRLRSQLSRLPGRKSLRAAWRVVRRVLPRPLRDRIFRGVRAAYRESEKAEQQEST